MYMRNLACGAQNPSLSCEATNLYQAFISTPAVEAFLLRLSARACRKFMWVNAQLDREYGTNYYLSCPTIIKMGHWT